MLSRLRIILSCFGILLPVLSGVARIPELSAIEPLEFDEAAQRLVARGDAELLVEDVRLRADRITYYQQFGLADAEGDVEAMQNGLRLLARRISYEIESETLFVQDFKTGRFPVYIRGRSAGGDRNLITLENATILYGEPGRLSPTAEVRRGRYVADDSVEIERARLRVGPIPIFYVPSYTHSLQELPLSISANAGFRSDLGIFLETETIAPVNNRLRVGANLNAYSRRGFLFGPIAQYRDFRGDSHLSGSINTGYINDSGGRRLGADVLERPISEDRGFAELRHQQHYGERFTLTVVASYWSDSEVTRDFRRRVFRDYQSPDNFVEGSYAGDNWIVSAFGRFRPNNFQTVQERLPEVRLDYLPTPVLASSFYHRGSVSYARLRERILAERIPGVDERTEVDRVDATYRLQHPLALTEWATLTPLIGGRLTHYSNQSLDATFNPDFDDRSFTRSLVEAGFDLEARAFADYPTRNRLWGVDGLRHTVRPVAHYRYFSSAGDDGNNRIAAIDRQIFDLHRPLLDFSDIRAIDTLTETHLVRLGLENRFSTRHTDGYGSRDLAAINFYQDVLFKRNTRYDGEPSDTFDATWVDVRVQPAHWLRLNVATRVRTESLKMEELRTRIALVSGETWELGVSSDYLEQRIDQYRVDFFYRLSERYAVLTDIRYDVQEGRFVSTRFGLHTRIGTAWDILYMLTLRENSKREDDVEFSVRVSLTMD